MILHVVLLILACTVSFLHIALKLHEINSMRSQPDLNVDPLKPGSAFTGQIRPSASLEKAPPPSSQGLGLRSQPGQPMPIQSGLCKLLFKWNLVQLKLQKNLWNSWNFN